MSIFTREKLIKYLAISITLMVCTTRLSMAAGNIFYAFAIIIGLVLFYKDKTIVMDKEIKGYIMATLVFFLSMVLSILFSPEVLVSFKAFCNNFLYRFIVFALIVVFIKRREYIVNILAAFMLVTCVDCLVVVYQLAKTYGTSAFNSTRGWGFGSNALTIAGVMVILMPVVLVFMYDSTIDKKLKKASKALFMCMIAGLFANKSRSTWLFIPVEILPILWQYIRKNTKQMLILFVIICSISGVFVTNVTYRERFKSVTNVTTDRSNSDRLRAWESSYDMFKDSFVVGKGLGTWRNVYIKEYKSVSETQNLVHAHNNFVMVASETGAIGLIGFLYFCFYFVNTSFKNWKFDKNPYDLIILCSFFGYIILFGQIEYVLDNSSGMRIFWFVIACLMQLKLLNEGTKNEVMVK